MKNISEQPTRVNSPVSNRPKRTIFESILIQNCWNLRCESRQMARDSGYASACFMFGQYSGLRRALGSYRRLSAQGEA